MESDNVKQLAVEAQLNLDFLHYFVLAVRDTPNITISTFFSKWQNKIKWNRPEPYILLNTEIWLMHLYALIVVPQQTFFDDIPNVPLEALSPDIWGVIDIRLWPDNKSRTLKSLVRVLRNALSHVWVLADRHCFIFQDRLNEKSFVHSIVAINTIDDLYKFIMAFSRGYLDGRWQVRPYAV